MEPVQTEAIQMKKEYEAGLAYFKQVGFMNNWPLYERFKSADQWPAATERTKNLPRPVFNIIELVEGHKVASVMSENIKMVYSTEEVSESSYQEAADKFNQVSEAIWETIKQDELNEEALDSAANIGTGIWHYYWDPSVKGGNLKKYQGAMCGETLDPINVFFGNPQQRKVQKQPYIVISSREMVDVVKEEAKRNRISVEMITMITPDKNTQDQGYDRAQVELSDSQKCTVLTRYWKKNGTIWFRKTASGIVIKPDTDTKRKLYPIAVMNWRRRKKSIHGVGDTEGLIPNQKTINFLIAMMVLSVQLTGWPKLVYKKDAIDKNKVTNSPGEMIEDKSHPGEKGVDYLNPAKMDSIGITLVDKFIEYTRQMTGANEAATGTAPSSDLNATAIMLLQKAAGIPIESVKRRFYQAMEDIGRIWEDFFKVNYNMARVIKVKDQNRKSKSIVFRGSDYADIDFNLKIDIGPSSTYSESLMMSSLDRFLDKGFIDFKQYLQYVPKTVVPFKERLLAEIEQKEVISGQSIDQMIAQLPTEVQQRFKNAPPQVKAEIAQQFMTMRGGQSSPIPAAQPNQQPQAPVPLG